MAQIPASESQHAAMRRKNYAAILCLLRVNEGLPGGQIAKRTGLAPQTVSVLVHDMEINGLVRRGVALRGQRGQPAIPLLLCDNGAYSIGIELGWRHVDVVLLDFAGHVKQGRRVSFPFPVREEVLAVIDAEVRGLLSGLTASDRARVLGVGFASPSTMHLNVGSIGAPDDIARKLVVSDLCEGITAATGLPVTWVNDGRASCLAECAFGRVHSEEDAGHIFISTYVGGGLFFEGKVVEGRNGAAGQFGATMVRTRGGETRALHVVASLIALERYLAGRGVTVCPNEPDSWNWDELEGHLDGWLDEAASALALVIANNGAILGMSETIIDGVLPRQIMARFANAVQAEIAQLPTVLYAPPQVLPGSIGPSAPAIGAAFHLLNQRFFAV